jgi:hypothetical protein
MKKKRIYVPQYASDIQINEKGRGTFNALTVLWQLKIIIKQIFAPSDEEISKLANSTKSTYDDAQAKLLKEREEDINRCYQYAEKLLREEIGPLIDDILWEFVGDIAKRTISELTPQVENNFEVSLQSRAKKVIKAHQKQKRWLLGLPDPARPIGTGVFKNEKEFLSALEDVLKAKGKLSQPEALHNLSQHHLYQGDPLNLEQCQKNAKTLRNWLNKVGLTWKEAIEKYSTESGK